MLACLCVPSQNVSVRMYVSFMAARGKKAQAESGRLHEGLSLRRTGSEKNSWFYSYMSLRK